MADVTYKPDRAGVGELLRGPEMRAFVHRVAEEAIPFAVSISPDAPPYGVGYRDAFRVDDDLEKVTVRGGRRAVARIVNDSDYAVAVELGWDVEHHQFGNHAGYHVLARTADHIRSL
jgi:hypothetical protein